MLVEIKECAGVRGRSARVTACSTANGGARTRPRRAHATFY